jgi:hypothetical protein
VNYAELAVLIQDYTQNDEQTFVDSIPTFVTQAETRIYNSVQLPSLRKNVTGVTSTGNKYLSCPSDFLSSFSLAVVDASGNYEYLLNKDVNFMRAAYPNPADTGLPQYYALFGPTVVTGTPTNELSFILAPTPDDTYTAELHYYYYPESIVTATTSWLGDNYSPVLLYGSLVEAYTFMKGEQDIMAFYQQKYTEALAQLNRLGTGLERGDAYRDGQAKIKVNP